MRSKLILFSIMFSFMVISTASALTVTFCPREWVWDLILKDRNFCSCNTGAACVDYLPYTGLNEYLYEPPGPGRPAPGARTSLIDIRYGTVLNQSQHAGQCVSYNNAVEGAYIMAKVYNMSGWRWGGTGYDQGEASCSLQYARVGDVPFYYGNYGAQGGCSYNTQERVFECALSTFGPYNTSYIAHFMNANVTWKMTMTNALTGDPIDNLLITVSGIPNYTDSTGVSYHKYINPFNDLAMYYGGTRVGDYEGTKWDLDASNPPGQDLAIATLNDSTFTSLLTVLSNWDGTGTNYNKYTYWFNGTLNSVGNSDSAGGGQPYYSAFTSGHLNGTGHGFTYHIRRYDGKMDKRMGGVYHYQEDITAYTESPTGMDITFDPPSDDINDSRLMIYVSNKYDRTIRKFFAKNATYAGLINYSSAVPYWNDFIATGITANNVYLWVTMFSYYDGYSTVYQFGLDGTYVGRWDTDLDQWIMPVGIETDGTYFWLLTDDDKVRKYWRVGNRSEGYDTMSQVLYADPLIEFGNSGIYCYPYSWNGVNSCDSTCGLQMSAITVDEDAYYFWTYIKDEDGDPVNGVLMTITADQDPGIMKSYVSYYDGYIQGMIYGLKDWTYSITLKKDGVITQRQSGFHFDTLTEDAGPAQWNYINWTVELTDYQGCSETYYDEGDTYWSNGTIKRDITVPCYSSISYEYQCNPGWQDGTDCYMGKEIHCLDDCSIEIKEAWGCDYGFVTYASTYIAPDTCDATYHGDSSYETDDIGGLGMLELVALGINTATGNNPGIVNIVGTLALVGVPVAAVAVTGHMAVGMMAFVGIFAFLLSIGALPVAILYIIGAVVVGYFFVTIFLNKGKGDKD